MNILLSTIGSAGDVYPFVGIARALQTRGHDVRLITSKFFESLVKDAGIDFIEIGTIKNYLEIVQNPDLWDPQKSFKFFAEKAVIPFLRPLYEIIAKYDPKKTVVIAQGQAFGAYMAHEKLGFPFATIQLQPAAFRSAYDVPQLPGWLPPFTKRIIFNGLDYFMMDKVLAPGINEFRRELGLASKKHIFANMVHSPQKTIGLFPNWFAPAQPDWPGQADFPGFIFYDNDNQASNVKEISTFINEGEAPIVFTPGTAMQHGEKFFKASVEASQLLGRRSILLSKHKDQIPEKLAKGIKHFEYAPFSELLPKSAAIVHHGGIGTMAQALLAGIPQLIRPMAHDQPENAIRIKRLGVGEFILPNDYQSKNIADKLEDLMKSSSVRNATQRFASQISPEQSMSETCDLIENMSSFF